MKYEMIQKIAEEAGFTHFGPLDPGTIQLKPEVRQMCQACRMYDKRWSCPPGCGELDECSARVNQYTRGILVQSVGELEDSMDYEAMMETEATQKERFEKMYAKLRALDVDVLALGAGCCKQCSECTYPNEPCRFPKRMVSSMEAYGMEVAAVCKANGLPYYYGQNTIAYTSCFLFREE